MAEPRKSTEFDRAGQILADALKVPPADRPALVAARCDGDTRLEQSVLALLPHVEHVATFLSSPPVGQRSGALMPGDLLANQFRIIDKLGGGGMGEVYRAEDLAAHDVVAVKTIRAEWSSSDEALDRFRAELRQARRIAHPNVCKVFHFHVEPSPRGGDLAFFTMQLLEGETLGQRLVNGPLTRDEALDLARGIAAGIDAAHAEDLIHRDLKPGNIMLVSRRDGTRRAVITDFGLSKDLTGSAEDRTVETAVVGSPAYMAPEQFDSTAKLTRATDLYAFALIVWEMLTRRRPLEARDALQLALRRNQTDLPRLSAVYPDAPAHWDDVFSRALARDPAARFESASVFVDALSGKPETVSQTISQPVPQALMVAPAHSRPLTRRAALYTGGSAILLSAGFVLARFLRHRAVVPNSPVLMLTATRHDPDQTSAQFAAAADLWLKSELQQSNRIQILPSRRIDAALQRLRAGGMPDPSLADPRTARQIALRQGARLVLFSTLAKAGEEYTLHVNLELLDQSPTTPEARWPFDTHFTEQDGASSLASRIGHLANQLRDRMGELEQDYDVHRRPAEDLTTANWDALQNYIAGNESWRAQKRAEAIRLIESATALDPGFALAWGRLGDLRMAVGHYDAAFDAYVQATAQVARKNLTDPESLRIRGIFALDREDYRAAADIFSEFRDKFAAEPLPYFYGADCARIQGQTSYANSLLQKAIRLAPDDSVFLVQRALYLLDDGDLTGAARQVKDAAVYGHNDFSPRVQAGIGISRLDIDAAEKALNSIADDNDRAGFLTCLNAERGRFSEAERILTESIAANATDSQEWFAKQLLLAGVYIAANRKSEAVTICRTLCARPPGVQSLQAAAVLARAGDPSRASEIVREASTALAERAGWPIYRRLTAQVQGEILLARGRAAEALAIFGGMTKPQDVNIWPEQTFRAALAAGREDIARPLTKALFENPGRWFVAAIFETPCFLRTTLEQTQTEGADEKTQNLRALRRMFT